MISECIYVVVAAFVLIMPFWILIDAIRRQGREIQYLSSEVREGWAAYAKVLHTLREATAAKQQAERLLAQLTEEELRALETLALARNGADTRQRAA